MMWLRVLKTLSEGFAETWLMMELRKTTEAYLLVWPWAAFRRVVDISDSV